MFFFFFLCHSLLLQQRQRDNCTVLTTRRDLLTAEILLTWMPWCTYQSDLWKKKSSEIFLSLFFFFFAEGVLWCFSYGMWTFCFTADKVNSFDLTSLIPDQHTAMLEEWNLGKIVVPVAGGDNQTAILVFAQQMAPPFQAYSTACTHSQGVGGFWFICKNSLKWKH